MQEDVTFHNITKLDPLLANTYDEVLGIEECTMTRLLYALAFATILLTLASTAAIYPWLGDQIPTHWNLQGQIDGQGPKSIAFLMPSISVGLFVLLCSLPWLSPKQFAIDTFRETYAFIVLTVMVTLAYVHGLMLWAALAGGVDITRALLAGLLIMFGLLGRAMTNVRRNFWVGVRTPWTIASERVWNDTHRLAAKMFLFASIVGIVIVALPLSLPAVTISVVALILLAAVGPALYSLVLYKQLERRGEI